MPNYDYECAQCGHREEILQKMLDEPLNTCPQCHQSTFKRKFGTGAGLQFQGSGFYCTDYSSSSSPSQPPPPSSEKPAAPPTAKGCGCGKSSCS